MDGDKFLQIRVSFLLSSGHIQGAFFLILVILGVGAFQLHKSGEADALQALSMAVCCS